ncbi:MAG: AFG1-family ATPase [Francisellaceae bacterium]|nr:AFG1-family ATPase [Francisellaceae bacterium]
MTLSLIEPYKEHIKNFLWEEDASQLEAIAVLDVYYQFLSRPAFSILNYKLFFITHPKKGIYLWGEVGRGKTFLMDLFFTTLPIKKKMRIHFHHFMKKIHQELNELKQTKQPLAMIANNLVKTTRVLCLDEFFIEDIADAFLLGNLFKALFEKNIIVILTSNTKPCRLYEKGLQREVFLPTIELLENQLEIVQLKGNKDYRLEKFQINKIYYYPINLQNSKAFEALFNDLGGLAVNSEPFIEIANRKIFFIAKNNTSIWFDFKAICEGPRGSLDYIEIANIFSLIFVSNIPILKDADNDSARRFIMLIDECYDRKIKLSLLAECSIDELYQGTLLITPFKRTISRLHEMQSIEYLKS